MLKLYCIVISLSAYVYRTLPPGDSKRFCALRPVKKHSVNNKNKNKTSTERRAVFSYCNRTSVKAVKNELVGGVFETRALVFDWVHRAMAVLSRSWKAAYRIAR